MRKIIFTLITLTSITNFTLSQDNKFILNQDSFTDFIVIQCEGKTQAELYKNSIDWISVTFKNPKEVIKAEIQELKALVMRLFA